jgi:hypothetical protein
MVVKRGRFQVAERCRMTDDETRSDADIQNAVRTLFLGSIPERESDLDQMWLELEPIFKLTPDTHQGDRVIMDAGLYRYIRFNHRVLRAFWIAAYAAWEGYRAVAESTSLDTINTEHFKSLLAAFESTISSEEPDLEPLPAGVAQPGNYVDTGEAPQNRAAAELATIATAWALLHELRHIRHQRESTGADPFSSDRDAKHHEELSCDEFATNFILEAIDRYAVDTGQPAERVQQKRQLAIYVALFAVSLLAKDKWGDTDTHPSVQRRLDASRALMAPQKSVLAAAIAHVAFGTLQQIWPGSPNPY